jgi:hypothetical protein
MVGYIEPLGTKISKKRNLLMTNAIIATVTMNGIKFFNDFITKFIALPPYLKNDSPPLNLDGRGIVDFIFLNALYDI